MGYVCPEKSANVMDSGANLTMALLGPQEFYCINNGTTCPVTATIKFRNNLMPCRTMSSSPESTATNGLTPALLVKDSCTSQFSQTNWKSGIDVELFKNANTFVGKQSAQITVEAHFEMLQGTKLESLKTCHPVTMRFHQEQIPPESCWSYTDPHIRTFSFISITSMAPGNYLMYKHHFTDTEVHTRQRQCIEYIDDKEIGCNQAVSIRSRNNVVVYEVNDGLLKEKRLMNDTLVPINIKTVRTERSYEVHLSNGDVVYVWLEKTKFSLTVYILSLTANLNNIEGFCSLKNQATATKDIEALRVPDNTAANFESIQKRTKSAGLRKYCKCGEGTENCLDTFQYYHCEHP
ncbi:von Willebrand factor D and EGF domain-containing protein-like [Physella acuta]|uniref:von Willebrand factor D and EGF domain-containing protein-like n=1 Tax=Physella acuta TaxID=109671 RepID=UPI0027DE236D|nr:von Willebrand factor D and EGF domain-containing protein-like [Physella acuta]